MEYQDLKNKRDTLRSVIKDLELQYVYSKTKLRLGDKVKFTVKGDYYIGEKDENRLGIIYDFEVTYLGDIYAECGNHQKPNINDCKKVKF